MAHAQAIFAATEHAEPGGVISVRGDALDGATKFTVYPYGADGKRQAGVKADLNQTSGSIALVRVPAALAKGVYEISGATVRGATNSFFLNRPRLQWADVMEAMPDGLVRIVGRNFKPFATSTPAVTLKNVATGATVAGTIVSTNDSYLAFKVPTGAPVGSYQISVNNGLAGAASADPNTLPLTVKAKAADPFSLGVSWGADFNAISQKVYNLKTDSRLSVRAKGDGVSDDTAAFTANLWNISRLGGGTVYLPAGTYRIDNGTTIQIPPNIVFKGDGKGKTVLAVGYRFTKTVAPPSNYWPLMMYLEGGTGLTGFTQLSIVNLNANASPNGIFRGWGQGSRVFFKNVEFRTGNGRYLWFGPLKKAVIADCDITSTSITESPIRLTEPQELQFVRNYVDFRAGRVALTFGVRNVIEDNVIRVDNAYHTLGSVETGGAELSMSQQLLVSNNDIQAYGPLPTKGPGDGEMLMTQLSNIPDMAYVGMVRSASGRILVPTTPFATTSWMSSNYPMLPRMAVMILSGKGAGQWRWATAWSTSSVLVDQPWQTMPDATSRFSITPMTAYQHSYINNRLSGGWNGVTLYQGAVDTVVSDNTLTNTGLIMLRGDCRGRSFLGSNYSFLPAWDVSITRNSVVNSNAFMPATITVCAIDIAGASFGPLELGVDVRYNNVVGRYLPKRNYEVASEEGLEVLSTFYTGMRPDYTINAGTILESNTVTGVTKPIQIRYSMFGEFSNRAVNLTSRP